MKTCFQNKKKLILKIEEIGNGQHNTINPTAK